MSSRIVLATLLALAGTMSIPAAHATLVDEGNGTVLDTSTGLLWLKDANLAATLTAAQVGAIIADVGTISGHALTASDFPGGGRMTWWGAMAWAQDLVYAGFSDWRLPSVTDTGNPGCDAIAFDGTDCGYNVDLATGELARLWYASLGNTGFYDTSGTPTGCNASFPYCFTNTGPFLNAQPPDIFLYWTSTEFAPRDLSAWYFNADFGLQYAVVKEETTYGWAVRRAGATTIAEPPTPALLAICLTGIALLRRRS